VSCRLERKKRETVRDSREGREDHAGGQMLKFWDDAFPTSLSAVVKHVVAVPTRTTACTHVGEPWPDVAGGSVNGDAWVSDASGSAMRLSPGSGSTFSAAVARIVLNRTRARGVAVTAHCALRRIAHRSCQLTNAPSGLMTRQYHENLRSATGESGRVACSGTNQCSFGRPVGATTPLRERSPPSAGYSRRTRTLLLSAIRVPSPAQPR
jgi:hypothetical protein